MLFILDWRSNSKGIKIPATNRLLIRIKKRQLKITMIVHDPILSISQNQFNQELCFIIWKPYFSNCNSSRSGSIFSSRKYTNNKYQWFCLIPDVWVGFFCKKLVRSQHYFSHKNSHHHYMTHFFKFCKHRFVIHPLQNPPFCSRTDLAYFSSYMCSSCSLAYVEQRTCIYWNTNKAYSLLSLHPIIELSAWLSLVLATEIWQFIFRRRELSEGTSLQCTGYKEHQVLHHTMLFLIKYLIYVFIFKSNNMSVLRV
jgi:hypothetical protein